ncbi:unnamed protein product [Psylliodes chrysocephalus]|uniref:Uncharacterized protein n=1 Tax=Psylliodes chrysocephalus TaxID=3402493 RepID=A0A9P0CZ70_9CUCU|nr:unnamed protein product [Psylliodes chrysocephala]
MTSRPNAENLKNFSQKSKEKTLYKIATNTQTEDQKSSENRKESLENQQESLQKTNESLQKTKESLEKTNKSLEKVYEAVTEPEEGAETDFSDNNSTFGESKENTDWVIRSGPNESLEKLLNTLEDSTDGFESPISANITVLEMKEDNSGDGTPDTIKKSSHISKFGKYGENDQNLNTEYKTLPMPRNVKAKVDPRIKIGIINTDISPTLAKSIMEYKAGSLTSEEENRDTNKGTQNSIDDRNLPHSPNSVFPIRTTASPEAMETNTVQSNEPPYQTPKRFSSNFQQLIREKSLKTITVTNNRFQALTDESESEYEDEIRKIVKRKRKMAKQGDESSKINNNNAPTQSKNTEKPTESKSNNTKPSISQNTPKKKNPMPPIVIEGKTTNQSQLIKDIKELVKGQFSIKHTNASTILFVEGREDYDRMVNNIKAEKMPYHTYTSYEDKSHAFVLRGLADGTQISQIEENLIEEYDIKTRSIFKMNTKNRPLFLIVTDPTLTLDYMNKNVRRVLYSRVT